MPSRELQEIAARHIPGYPGMIVSLHSNFSTHRVVLTTDHDEVLYEGSDRERASDAFLHTFVNHPLAPPELAGVA